MVESTQTELDLRVAVHAHNESVHAVKLQEARYNLRMYGIENHGEEKYAIPYSATSEDARILGEITAGKPGKQNWMGSLFKEKVDGMDVWTCTGRWYEQKARGQHARPVRIWCLTREWLSLHGRIK